MLTIGHSPDADDAFMWWALGDAGPPSGREVRPRLMDPAGRFLFRPVLADIEELNRRAMDVGDLDITAVSAHSYPHVRGRYALTCCGASVGDGFGPKVVSREAHAPQWLVDGDPLIAVPGERTSAFLALCLMLGKGFRFAVTPFQDIIEEVRSGRVDAGLVIHEGQLTYGEAGLCQVVDLGAWWKEKTSLPLPLGLNAARRDLDERFGPGSLREATRALRASIDFALKKRPVGLEHAMQYSRGITVGQADRFVNMYVNAYTRDLGARGVEAIRRFLTAGHEAGLCPDPGTIDVIEPAVRPS